MHTEANTKPCKCTYPAYHVRHFPDANEVHPSDLWCGACLGALKATPEALRAVIRTLGSLAPEGDREALRTCYKTLGVGDR